MIFKIDHSSLLKSIPRKKNRDNLQLEDMNLPFIGQDIWTLYEVSWLNKNGFPQIAILKIEINITSINIIESKSFKIYMNSFNQIKFDSIINFINMLKFDLSQCVCGTVSIVSFDLHDIKKQNITEFDGLCIDDLDMKINCYEYNQSFLKRSNKKKIIEESLYSNLLKSNCPITQQPDWASIQIIYTGREIDHHSLLYYLISFRNHNEFHEECIERIFHDINSICQPEKLSIYARYTRRGGIDINPWRSNNIFSPCLIRLSRQ